MKNNILDIRLLVISIAGIALSLSSASSAATRLMDDSVYTSTHSVFSAKDLLTRESTAVQTTEANKSLKWLKAAAAHQYPEALYSLGYYHEHGMYGIEKSYLKAIALYKKAALKGHVTSRLSLSNLYLNQDLYTYDRKQGHFWLKLAAEQQDTQAQFSLAMFYKDQLPSTSSETEMLKWLETSAINGHKDAQYTLGIFYLEGRFLAQDATQAFHWFTKAALQGDAASQYNLGFIYQTGNGALKDQQKSIYWYQKAIAQHEPYAQFQLGRKHLIGEEEGVEKDINRGMMLIKQAADAGNPAAQTMLATYLHQQEKNFERAFELFLAAAQKDYPEAQFQVSVMFAKGQGVTKDEAMSVHWISKAAEQNHPTAQYGLAAYLFNGVGIKKDIYLAAYWMSRAARLGQKHALESKAKVIEMLDESQRNSLDEEMRMIEPAIQ